MSNNTENHCGGCAACCFTHAIRKIKPQTGVWCQFCRPNIGCRVYSRRPKECRDFRCEWLKVQELKNNQDIVLRDWHPLIGDESRRPDQSGVVLDFCSRGLRLGKQLQIWEAKEGAIGEVLVWKITRLVLGLNIPVVYLYLSGRRMLFLPDGRELSKSARAEFAQAGCEITNHPIVERGMS